MKKDLNGKSLEKITKYIIKNYHDSNRKVLEKLKFMINDINDEDIKLYPKLQYLNELFLQFKSEYLKHMEKEELITFPTIIKYEKIFKSDKKVLPNDIKLNYIEMKNEHDVFGSYLVSINELFKVEGLNKKIKKLAKMFYDIQENNLYHAELENNIVYPSGNDLQNKLFSKK
ncbi:hypothetical protein EOM39_01935 [Candidatus Gracilibacteria bacterium]|nr:hypothetical protein [Candidatus Gracilibacteria bacterium]